MRIGVPSSVSPPPHRERRVSITPETVARLVNRGHEVVVERGAGEAAHHPDEAYAEGGAELADRATAMSTDVVVTVNAPQPSEVDAQGVLGLLRPFDDHDEISALAASGADLFAFEAVPRTTRAQSMDVLSSQATAVGYQALLEGARRCPRFFPMLTTAAGTIKPATVVVLGAGVAGLQAIATARRLGAVVAAFDVRSAAAEQVESLGARFIDVDVPAQDASASGGYAKEMADEQQNRVVEALAEHVARADVVVSTAAIPGRPAPRLISTEGVEGMKPGAVIVDVAAPTGGNCELTVPGEVIVHRSITVVGTTDLVGEMATHASEMFGRNAAAFLELLADDGGSYGPDWNDEIVAGSVVARNGELVHHRLTGASA